jgi:diguanylate cyclase (GGDEF)-like protein/PAS domain S-box-containing protein
MMKQYQGVSIQPEKVTLSYTNQKENKTLKTNDLEPFLSNALKPSIMNQPHWLTHTLDNTVDGIIITTSYLEYPGPEIVYVNQAFTQMTGYTHKDIIGRTPRILQGPKTNRQVLKRLKRELTEGKIFKGTTINYRKDGTEFYNKWLVEPIRNAHGEITHYLSIQQDITDHQLAKARLLYDANRDPLTGLLNRTGALEQLEEAVAKSKSYQDYLFAVLLLDLDRFKLINDSWGHPVGDQLLQNVAQRLQNCLRPTDMIARLGGDEFFILLSNIQDLAQVSQVAERIQQQLNKPFILGEYEVFITASIGIALSSNGYEQTEDIFRDADTALYRAKARGKACHAIFNKTMHHRALERLQLENDLRRAVEQDQLQLHYQPILNLKTHEVEGFEALVRWHHPTKGLIAPDQFIPIAEETGMIRSIGRWVLEEACKTARLWEINFPSGNQRFMSVNLSIYQLTQSNFLETVTEILQQTQCHPDCLRLEITESEIMNQDETAILLLQQLRSLGVKLCIDDFGTGYSSLSRLYYFPTQTLKIDRSFVSGMNQSVGQAKIAEAIIDLAHHLGMDVVAEGVETAEQLTTLKNWGCEYAQGYWIARPAAQEEIETVLVRSQPHPYIQRQEVSREHYSRAYRD